MFGQEEDGSGTGAPVSSVEKRPKTKEEVLSFVEDSWNYLSHSRLGLEQEFKEAIHFYGGDQWVRYMPHARRFVKHALDEWVPTPVTNLIVQHVDRALDIFTSGDIKPVVDPATQDLPDVDAAKAAQRILHSEFERLRTEERLLIPTALWMIITGNAFISATWDAKAGNRYRKPRKKISSVEVQDEVLECSNCGATYPKATGLERCRECNEVLAQGYVHSLDDVGRPVYMDREEDEVDEAGRPIYDEYSLGDVSENVISPLNFYPMPARSMQEVRYAIEVDPMDLDRVKALFGKKAEDVVAENLEHEEHGGIYGGALQTFFQPEREKNKDLVLVKFFRHVPDRRWKKGLMIIVANGHILYEGNLDSCDEFLPYTHFKYRNIPGSFWGGSLLRDIIPLQKRINSIDSHVVQNRKQMVSNQWLVPEGSGVSKVDGRSGLVIRWTPSTSGGFKPERMQGVPLPNQVIQEREMMKSDMEMVSGAREVLSGDVPPGPETGAAIEAMQEQAFRRFGPLVKLWRSGLAEHERRKLLNISKYWKEPRIVKILGENSELESFYYEGADLIQATDMSVRVGIGMDFSQSAHRQKIMQAAQQGLLGDMRNPAIRGKVLEKLGIEGFDSEYSLDAKKARRYLERLKGGEQIPPPEPIDNHGIQFSVYKDYMLTSDFEGLEEDVKNAIRQRAQIHQQVMQQEQQKAMAAAQAAKGAPQAATEGMRQSGAMGNQPTQQRG